MQIMSFLEIVTKPGYPIYKQIILHNDYFYYFLACLIKHSLHAKANDRCISFLKKTLMYK